MKWQPGNVPQDFTCPSCAATDGPAGQATTSIARGWQRRAGRVQRASIIYRTNMDTSYAAGRWHKLMKPETLRALPLLALHPTATACCIRLCTWPGTYGLAGRTPTFWRAFRANGWGAGLRATVSRREGTRPAPRRPRASPRDGTRSTPGPAHRLASTGFDLYAPGAATDVPLRQFVQDKLITYRRRSPAP